MQKKILRHWYILLYRGTERIEIPLEKLELVSEGVLIISEYFDGVRRCPDALEGVVSVAHMITMVNKVFQCSKNMFSFSQKVFQRSQKVLKL